MSKGIPEYYLRDVRQADLLWSFVENIEMSRKPLSGCPQNHAPTPSNGPDWYAYRCDRCGIATMDCKSESAARRAWNALVEKKRKEQGQC